MRSLLTSILLGVNLKLLLEVPGICSMFTWHTVHLIFQLRNDLHCVLHNILRQLKRTVGLNTVLCLFCCFGGDVFHLPAIHSCFMQQHLFTFAWHIKHTKTSLSCFINVSQIVPCFHTDKLDKEILVGQQINQTHRTSSNFCRLIVFCFSLKGQRAHKENENIFFPQEITQAI